jgi:hypothetical protein
MSIVELWKKYKNGEDTSQEILDIYNLKFNHALTLNTLKEYLDGTMYADDSFDDKAFDEGVKRMILMDIEGAVRYSHDDDCIGGLTDDDRLRMLYSLYQDLSKKILEMHPKLSTPQ